MSPTDAMIGTFRNATNTAGVRVAATDTLPGTWTSYVDLGATGTGAVVKTPHVTLRANGAAVFGTGMTLDTSGNVEFSGALAAATGSFAGSLAAASGTFGTITSGHLTNPAGTAAIRLGGSVPLPADNFIDMTATGGAPFLKHGNLVLAANAGPIAKTLRFPHTLFRWQVGQLVLSRTTISIDVPDSATAWHGFTMPKGVTLTALRLRARSGQSGWTSVSATLHRVNDTGGSTQIASVGSFTNEAWSTRVDSLLNELVGDNTYVLEVVFNYTSLGGFSFDILRQLAWVELDYDMPDYSKSI